MGFLETLVVLEEEDVLGVLATTKFEAFGVLSAAVTAPLLVTPREWLGLLLREEFSDEAALKGAVGCNAMVRVSRRKEVADSRFPVVRGAGGVGRRVRRGRDGG